MADILPDASAPDHYPRWNQATVVSTSTGFVTIAPVTYQNRLFVTSATSPNSFFNLNDLTYLHSKGNL